MADVQIAIIDQQNTQIALAAPPDTQVTAAVPGVQGPKGEGVPTGGTANQVLFKQSGTNYDTAWGAITSAMIGDLQIVDGDVSTTAAIAGTKISPNFGAQNVVTTGTSTAASFIPTSSTVPTNGVYLPAANSVAISTGGSGRLFVDASGNVGINAASTGSISTGIPVIEIKGNSAAQTDRAGGIRFTRYDGVVGAEIYNADGATYIDSKSTYPLIFYTGGTEKMVLDSSGRLGLGTSSPSNILHVAGTSSTPAVFDRTDTTGSFIALKDSASQTFIGNTNGVFSIQTPGSSYSDKLVVTSAGLVGIGTTSPITTLHVDGTGAQYLRTSSSTYSNFVQTFAGNGSTGVEYKSVYRFVDTDNGERARIDSSGRLLVGTSTARDKFFNASSNATTFQVERVGASGAIGYQTASFITNSSDGIGSYVTLGASRGTAVNSYTALQSGDVVGKLAFQGADGTELVSAAEITAVVDGTPGANDMPGRLVFSTTADGAASPTERMRIDSSGRVGIGTTSPNVPLHISAGSAGSVDAFIRLENPSTTAGTGAGILFTTGGLQTQAAIQGANTSDSNNGYLAFQVRGGNVLSERARIDSSGRLLVGTSTARSNFFNATVASQFQVEGATAATAMASVVRCSADADASNIVLGKTRSASVGGNTIVNSNDQIGQIGFHASDGTELVVAATIRGEVDGTPGANDMPGRLVFSTTADGASSPTERMRIDSSGRVGLGTSSPGATLHVEGLGNTVNQRIFTSDNVLNATASLTFGTTPGTRSKAALQMINVNTGNGAGALALQTNEGSTLATRLYIADTGRVGIGTQSPWSQFSVNMDANNMRFGTALDAGGNPSIDLYRWQGTSTNYKSARISCLTDGSISILNATANSTDFSAQSFTERARIDSSGRLLVGTSTSPSAGLGQYARMSAVGYTGSATGEGIMTIARGKAATSMVSGDTVGQLSFTDINGNDFAKIVCSADATPGSGDYPGVLAFSVTADGASSPTERMRISNDGWTNLFVTNNDGFQSRNSAAAGTSFGFFVGRHSATGTTDGTISYVVYTNGNVANTNNSYGAISDIKLKENIVDANSQWDDIKALQVRNYNFKEGQTHTQIGLVAQEVELVSPGLVTESPDRDEDGNDLGTVTKSVNYSVLYMKAVKALQEAMERIETLEAKVAALEGA